MNKIIVASRLASKDLRNPERSEKWLPVLLRSYRKFKQGRGTPIYIEDYYIDRSILEQLLKKYFEWVVRRYYPKIKHRRLKRFLSLSSLPALANYDWVINISPDRRSSIVQANEYTLLTRIDIRKLPYTNRLNSVREHLIEFLEEALVRFSRRREAKVRARATKILLNIWSYRLWDKPRRNLSEEERKRVLYIARIDINEWPHYWPEALKKARNQMRQYYPRRVTRLKYILQMARRGDDLWNIYLSIKELLSKRYRIPRRIRQGLENILLEIRQYRSDPYKFLMDSIENTLANRLGFFTYRSGKYALIIRPWPSNTTNRTIADLHRLLLALGVTAVKIYIRTRREYIADRLKAWRSSPYALWPTLFDTELKPRNDYEAVLRIEVNVALRHLRNDYHRYLLALLLLLLANLSLGFGPWSIALINELLWATIYTHLETLLSRLFQLENPHALKIKIFWLTKHWLDPPSWLEFWNDYYAD